MSTELLVALVNFGAHYHGGGHTRVYRVMCRAARALARRGHGAGGYAQLDRPMTPHTRALYRRLVARYGDE